MESKMFVYAVIAVALGYLLVSTVPEQLAALQGETLRGEGFKAIESLEVEEPKVTGEEPETPTGEEASEDLAATVEEAKSAADAAKAAAEEAEAAAGLGPGGDIAATISMWIVNLLIALGVYFIAKRRLS